MKQPLSIVALAYCPADADLAQKLIDWINELGGFVGFRLLLAREQTAPKLSGLPKDTTEIPFSDVYKRWPISTTLAFSTAARYIEHYSPNEPWLWLEPDVVPLKPGWLTTLKNEYAQTEKLFMGSLVSAYQGTPAHMSGIGVWPGHMTKYAGPALLFSDQTPFDLQAIEMIYGQCHFTDLIVHRWGRNPPKGPINSMEELYKIVSTECALFHADKTSTLIPTLRKHFKSLAGAETSQKREGAELKPPSVVAHRADELCGTSGTQSLSNGESASVEDPIEAIKKRFTSPLAKARVMKQLKAAPIIKK